MAKSPLMKGRYVSDFRTWNLGCWAVANTDDFGAVAKAGHDGWFLLICPRSSSQTVPLLRYTTYPNMALFHRVPINKIRTILVDFGFVVLIMRLPPPPGL